MYWYCGESIESQIITLDISDPGLLYGATVFTTFRTDRFVGLDPRLLREVGDLGESIDLHCDRLRLSIEDLGWIQPEWRRVRLGIDQLIPVFPVLRITIFPDGRELITGRELPPHLATWQTAGVTVIIADRQFTRSLHQHKTGNYLAPWLALQQARNQNIQEAILIDDRGNWLETTTGNLWGYRNGCWYTPPLSAGILPGIARSQIINLLQRENKSVAEINWDREWVKELDSIGYSNSVVRFIPIHTVVATMGTLKYQAQHPAMSEVINLLGDLGGYRHA
jgi:4-amino-4-deoxychorismate lyase